VCGPHFPTFRAIAAGTREYMRLKEAMVCLEPGDTCPGESDLMRALIPGPVALELVPDAAKAADAVSAELTSTSILEAIRVRELTRTSVLQEILQSRASSHWGINE
jgi:hypothetical protein